MPTSLAGQVGQDEMRQQIWVIGSTWLVDGLSTGTAMTLENKQAKNPMTKSVTSSAGNTRPTLWPGLTFRPSAMLFNFEVM